ncbi:uncharacterized protein LOC128241890 [Mya arenaria]|uniref:uncharacterized protein LOC128241890 n=1 Tax=Mya arenaria TaxID=6604 RepID=UPI0022E2A779|nr:uncharacterized protein LOC128241890 [Mya arenaria]
MHAFSSISAICEKKKSWAIQQESQLKEFVQNSFTGRLYLMKQNFEQEISEVKKEIREAKCKHNVKLFCLKESKVALKCLIEDLRDVCELQEEVDGSDEGTTYAIGDTSTDQQKTRKEFVETLIQAKQDVDKVEMAKDELCDELKQMKQKLDTSEKMRMELHDELERVKQDLDNSRKECALLQAKGLPIKQCIERKQPTGSVEVTVSQYHRFSIGLLFTFHDGIQTRYHPFPGQPYKGSTIAGRLKNDSEGQTVCRMLKTAFRKGRMFTVGHDGNVWLSGISMFDSDFLAIVPISHYAEYIQGVKAELKAKGITEDTIDQTETVEGIFIVDGP